MTFRRLATLCSLGIAASASAATSTVVLKTTTTWDGTAIQSVGSKCPEVDAVVVNIEPNASTPVHLHPVNNYAYVLEGEVTVETGDMAEGALVVKKAATFKKGDAFAELVDAWHRGRAGPHGVKILVWYTSEIERPFTVAYRPDYRIGESHKNSARCDSAPESAGSPGR